MPSIEEMRYDPKARMEGVVAARRLRPEHLVEVIETQKKESADTNRAYRDQMEEAWRLYQSDAEYGDKEDWQSAVWIPMPFTACEQATSIIQRSFLESPQFFNIEGHDQRDKMVADHLLKPMVSLYFSMASFTPIFTDAVKMAFITGISSYLKFRFRSQQIPTVQDVVYDPDTGMAFPVFAASRRQYLTIDVIPAFQVYRDPKSKSREQWSGRYIMHEEYVDRGYLQSAMASRQYQNVEKVLSKKAGTSGMDSREEIARRRGQSYFPSKYLADYLATEWYGDIPDENGDLIMPDAWMIGCEEDLILAPRDCPVWSVDSQTGRRKWPLVAFSPLSNPLRFEGWGILRAVLPLSVLFNNLFNLFADGLNWSVNPPSEVDLTVLEDWYDTDNYPGKLWKKTQQGQAFTASAGGRMEAGTILATLQYFNQLFENSSFVTSFVSGLPGNRSNITKGEVQIKTAQSMGIFEGMGRNIEDGGARCVEITVDLIAQYLTEFTDPNILEIVGPVAAQLLSMMPPGERYRNLHGNFNFTFTGISTSLQKADQLGRLLQVASLAASGPYLGLTDPRQLLSAIIDSLGVRDKVQVNPVPMVPMSMTPQLVGGAAGDKSGEDRGGPSRRSPGRRLEPPSIDQLQPTPNEMSTAVAS